MDINVISNLIGSVGFPIVMCIFFITWIQKLTEQQKETEKRYQDERMKMMEVVNNNTLALTVLTTKFDELIAKRDTEKND